MASGAGASIAAVILLFAGALKVRHRPEFASQITAYEIVPAAVAVALGSVLPFLEILAGVLVLFLPRAGGPLSAALFLSFAAAVEINLLRGRTELRCGCFGPSGQRPIRGGHVAMNLALAAAAAVAGLGDGPPSLAAARMGLSMLLLAMLLLVGRELRGAKQESEARR
jgi:Methylamine utilisation protein MauE